MGQKRRYGAATNSTPAAGLVETIPARGQKEGDAARRMGPDLSLQRFALLSEQRPENHGHHNQIDKKMCRCRELFRPECGQRFALVGLRDLAQYPAYGVLAALARHAVHTGRQFGKTARFGNSHPTYVNRVVDQDPVQERRGRVDKTFFDCRSGRNNAFKSPDGDRDVSHHDGGKDRLFVWITGINGRLAGARGAALLLFIFDAPLGEAASPFERQSWISRKEVLICSVADGANEI